MNENDVCCPEFDVQKWDNKTFNWESKPFIRESIPTLFHIPFPPMIGKAVTKMMAVATSENKLEADKTDTLLLFQDVTPFKSNILLGVTEEVSGGNNVTLSGTYLAKVYDGGFNEVPNFIKDMNSKLNTEGKPTPKNEDYLIHYAYCPQCAEKYKHNYMILFAKI